MSRRGVLIKRLMKLNDKYCYEDLMYWSLKALQSRIGTEKLKQAKVKEKELEEC